MHAMHAERDIVLTVSLFEMNAHMSSQFFDDMVWASFLFLSTTIVTEFQGEHPQRSVKYTGWGNFAIIALLSRKRYEIGP